MRLAGRLEQARQLAKSMFDKSVLETSHSSNRHRQTALVQRRQSCPLSVKREEGAAITVG